MVSQVESELDGEVEFELIRLIMLTRHAVNRVCDYATNSLHHLVPVAADGVFHWALLTNWNVARMTLHNAVIGAVKESPFKPLDRLFRVGK